MRFADVFVGLAVLATACAPADEPTAVKTTTQTPTRPAPTPVPEVGPAPSGDFRMVQLDPDHAIGTTAKCDLARIQIQADKDPPVIVTCAGNGHHASAIALAVPREALVALTERTQIEVRIDGATERNTGTDARATFIAITGKLPEPEPPSACLCDRDRERAREADKPKPPTPWDFKQFASARETYWGTKQACKVNLVTEIARSSPTAREYGVGRVFRPEELPYAAEVWCTSAGGSERVSVGSSSPYAILELDRDQVVEIEIGWARSSNFPSGRLIRTLWRPDRDY